MFSLKRKTVRSWQNLNHERPGESRKQHRHRGSGDKDGE